MTPTALFAGARLETSRSRAAGFRGVSVRYESIAGTRRDGWRSASFSVVGASEFRQYWSAAGSGRLAVRRSWSFARSARTDRADILRRASMARNSPF